MKLRIFTEPQQGSDYTTLLRVAKATEDLGFDAFFRSDHYLKMGDVSGLPGPTDAWITLAGLAVYGYFLSAHQDRAYAQLTLTYTLVLAGLLLVVFIRPPKPLKPGRDWLFAVMAVILMAIFLVLPAIRLAQKYLGLYWLQQPADYLIVGIAVLCWGVVLQLTWLILRLLRRPRALRST